MNLREILASFQSSYPTKHCFHFVIIIIIITVFIQRLTHRRLVYNVWGLWK